MGKWAARTHKIGFWLVVVYLAAVHWAAVDRVTTLETNKAAAWWFMMSSVLLGVAFFLAAWSESVYMMRSRWRRPCLITGMALLTIALLICFNHCWRPPEDELLFDLLLITYGWFGLAFFGTSVMEEAINARKNTN